MMPPPPFAVGLGYDVHQFADGRPLILCGVEFDEPFGLLGHSDADVPLHALCDALLGAAGLRDIGHYFPNTGDEWKDADSRDLLRNVRSKLRDLRWQVGNVDLTIIAEKPKISSRVEDMRANIADDLSINISRVSIKATTNETMGFVGRGEGIAAMATALIWKPE